MLETTAGIIVRGTTVTVVAIVVVAVLILACAMVLINKAVDVFNNLWKWKGNKMAKRGLNMKTLAKEVTALEKGKKEVNIAQTAEMLKCTFIVLAKKEPKDVLDTIDRYRFR